MAPPSKVLVSSVVRGANQGDSHGGLYLVDFEQSSHEQLLDWNNSGINFEGRGADRGLRGIVIVDDLIFVAASDELFAFDKRFRILGSWRSPFLKHCHEMSRSGGSLYLTSTGFDSVLRFDLKERRFDLGLRVSYGDGRASAAAFDPGATSGPSPSMSLHLNNVHVDEFGVYISGLKMPALLHLTSRAVGVFAEIPLGTHNAMPFRGGVLLNDTDADSVVWHTPQHHVSLPVPQYAESDLLHADADASGVARQAFARGLCVITDTLIAGGSSPTTASLYDISLKRRIKSVNLTMDVRNAAHGLALWPF